MSINVEKSITSFIPVVINISWPPPISIITRIPSDCSGCGLSGFGDYMSISRTTDNSLTKSAVGTYVHDSSADVGHRTQYFVFTEVAYSSFTLETPNCVERIITRERLERDYTATLTDFFSDDQKLKEEALWMFKIAEGTNYCGPDYNPMSSIRVTMEDIPLETIDRTTTVRSMSITPVTTWTSSTTSIKRSSQIVPSVVFSSLVTLTSLTSTPSSVRNPSPSPRVKLIVGIVCSISAIALLILGIILLRKYRARRKAADNEKPSNPNDPPPFLQQKSELHGVQCRHEMLAEHRRQEVEAEGMRHEMSADERRQELGDDCRHHELEAPVLDLKIS